MLLSRCSLLVMIVSDVHVCQVFVACTNCEWGLPGVPVKRSRDEGTGDVSSIDTVTLKRKKTTVGGF